MCFWNRISSNGLKIPSFSYQLPGLVKFIKTYERKLVVAWVVFWVLVSISTFWYFSSQAMEKRTETLASMCDERARMLQDQFNVSFNRFQAISILISTFHHGKIPSAIDQRTFSECTDRTFFERPLTSGVAYATRVHHSEREEFERQQGWTIRRMEEQNPVHKDEYGPEALEPSPVQEEYAPVIFAQDPISHVVSFDMLSGKEDRENVLRARSSGKGGLTAPFPLIKTNRLGVILTFAVYKSDLPSNATPKERIEATNGYLGGVFDIESLVENMLLQLASQQTILVNVYDTTNHYQPITIFGSNVSADGWEHVSRLNFGDPFRKHEMRCRFKQKPPWPVLSMVTSVGILVIALLVAHIIHENCHKMEQLKKKAEAADVAKSQAARDRYTEFSTGNYRAKPGSSSSDAKTNTDLPDRTFTNSQMDGIAFEIKQSLDELNKIRSQLGKIICCLLLLFFVAAYMSTRLIGERGVIDRIAVNVPKMPKDIPAEGTENPRDRYTEFSSGNYGAKPESSSSDAKMNTDLLDRTFTNSRMHDKVKPPKIQVFINFRGVQLRNNFVGYLVDALRRSEINVFIDNHEQKGEDLNTLFKRIEDSGIAIVVFSSRYTESKWCLEELVKIKERVHQGLLKVLPIFYKVTPINVKRLKGDFGDHFRDKEYMYQSDEPMIKRWKEAIMFVSHKFALTFDENSSVMEIDFVETIVVEVLEMLQAIFKVESGQSSCNLVCADKAKLKRG